MFRWAGQHRGGVVKCSLAKHFGQTLMQRISCPRARSGMYKKDLTAIYICFHLLGGDS